MSRIFVSHSSRDSAQAICVQQWLIEQDPPLANEIFLDLDPRHGIRGGERWKDALRRANTRCEAVICLVSPNWENSFECQTEYRTAENLYKQIFCARIDPHSSRGMTGEWQQIDLYVAADAPESDVVEFGMQTDSGLPVRLSKSGLLFLRDSVRGAGIGADSFIWPPRGQENRAPYRGWEPLEEQDAAVFYGRDSQIVRGLDVIRGMRTTATASLMVILGPSGAGKSSFLRAGLVPRLRREDRRFVPLGVVRPQRNALTGASGLAEAIYDSRRRFRLPEPSRGDIKGACRRGDVEVVAGLLAEIRAAAHVRLLSRPSSGDTDAESESAAGPTLVLPLDQAEELFNADAGEESGRFLELISALMTTPQAVTDREPSGVLELVVVATIRTDRFEALQTAPSLARVESVVFDDLKPMPPTQFKEVITGPAGRATSGGRPLNVDPQLVDQLLTDGSGGADSLPLLALTLARLYTDYGETGRLTIAEYESMGGMSRVVQNEFDDVLSRDPTVRQAQLDVLRETFIPWLAAVDPDSNQPMRRLADRADLPTAAAPLLDALVQKRLLVQSRNSQTGTTTVEVALESVLRQWEPLIGWLNEQQQDLKDADVLIHNAAAWRASSTSADWLLTGTRLAEAESLAAKAGFSKQLDSARAYLTSSRDRETKRKAEEDGQRRREVNLANEAKDQANQRAREASTHAQVIRRRAKVLRGVLVVTVVIAVIAVIGFGVAVSAENRADREAHDALDTRADVLDAHAGSTFVGTGNGNHLQAIAETLAAQRIRTDPNDSRAGLYNATTALVATRAIIPTGDQVVAIALSPDGNILASGGLDHTIRLWEVSRRSRPSAVGPVLTGHTGAVNSVAFARKGIILASGSDDGTIRLWDVKDPAHAAPIGQPVAMHAGVISVAFSPDGKVLASGGADGKVQLWDVTDADRLVPVGGPLIASSKPVYAVAFNPDGTELASGSFDGSIALWDSTDPRRVVAIGVQVTGQTAVTSLAFRPDGKVLASGHGDDNIRLWNVADPTGLHSIGALVSGHTGIVRSVAFNSDGNVLASGSFDGSVRLWDVADPLRVVPIGQPLNGHTGAVNGVSFSSDGKTLASGSLDRTVRLWEVNSAMPLSGHSGSVTRLVFSSDGKTLASGSGNGAVQLWDVSDPNRAAALGGPLTLGSAWVTAVAFSPDTKIVASGNETGAIELWDLTDPTHAVPLGGVQASRFGAIDSVAFSSDGKMLASGNGNGMVLLWNTTDPRHVALTSWPLIDQDGAIRSLAFTRDRKVLASVSDNNSGSLWNVTNPAHAFRLGMALGLHAAFLTSIAFRPDGRVLASGSDDNTLSLWDTTNPVHVVPLGKSLAGHRDVVSSVAFSPDGTMLASGSSDGTVRLWDDSRWGAAAAFGQPLTGHTSWVNTVAFSPDGKVLASGSRDGTIRLWLTPQDATPALLCSKLTENISQQQWNDWISPSVAYVKLCPDLPGGPETDAGTNHRLLFAIGGAGLAVVVAVVVGVVLRRSRSRPNPDDASVLTEAAS